MNRLVHRSATTAPGLLLPAPAACGDRGGGGGFAEPADTASSKSGTTTAATLQSVETDGTVREGCTVPVGRAGPVTFVSERDKRGESAGDADRPRAWPVVDRRMSRM